VYVVVCPVGGGDTVPEVDGVDAVAEPATKTSANAAGMAKARVRIMSLLDQGKPERVTHAFLSRFVYHSTCISNESDTICDNKISPGRGSTPLRPAPGAIWAPAC
jgi:hypothetical protein